MLLTTRSSYGVRALIHLAIAYGQTRQPVSVRSISREEGISGVYLEQIFGRLKSHDIVKSVRGPKGGYILVKDPSKVSVYEVVMALEGNISPGKCVGNKTICRRAGKCASKEVWDEVTRQITVALERFNLKDLAGRTLEIDPDKGARKAPVGNGPAFRGKKR